MKKLLLSFSAMCFAVASMAQSGNSVGSDFAIWNFNGTQDENCGTVIPGTLDALAPHSLYNQATYADYSFDGNHIVINKNDGSSDVAANAWHKIPFTFATDCNTPTTINLSDLNDHYVKMRVTSSVAIPQMIVFFRVDGAYADNNPYMAALTTGDNTVEFTTKIDWGVYNGGNPPTVKLDSANVDGIAIAFRTAWNDNSPQQATIKINYIEIGVNAPSGVSGTSNPELPAGVSYYPNPTNSTITVDNMDVTSLKVMNLNGQVVKEGNNSSISVEELNSGLYFLQINNYKPVKISVE